ncbi:MAG: AAA family ATPase [Bacteroidetes bacterium]|nr:AAA family ATPase [Bacteroidota bacterium]MBU1718985.1 AAA family ATPase [Bacteroidota bacterium]
METLYRRSFGRLNQVKFDFFRYLYFKIDWQNRLIFITGTRGVGKTTMILQYIKANLPMDSTVVYLSLDDIYFTEHKLIDVVEDFHNMGGTYLFLDEVHKYKNWNIEIKNIYDNYPDIKIVVTGSSVLNILEGKADLSRRMTSYHLENMSLREFIEFEQAIKLPILSLPEILSDHIALSMEISRLCKPLASFKQYLEFGCFPFYKESISGYHEKLRNVINTILEVDMASVVSVDFEHFGKLKQLLFIISQSVPFSPNLTHLASKTSMQRRTVVKYFDLLQRSGLVNLLVSDKKGLSLLGKPEKVYLANTNYSYALAANQPNVGNLRETFFFNQVKAVGDINYTRTGDFLINSEYTAEVGGKNKDFSQISNIPDSFLAVDDIASGVGMKIPLWLFGFLY